MTQRCAEVKIGFRPESVREARREAPAPSRRIRLCCDRHRAQRPVSLVLPQTGLDSRGGPLMDELRALGAPDGQYHCHRSPCSAADVRRHRRHGH